LSDTLGSLTLLGHTILLASLLLPAMKFKKGDKVRIYTDGQKIYIDRFDIPEI
jgi:hypothetical protein